MADSGVIVRGFLTLHMGLGHCSAFVPCLCCAGAGMTRVPSATLGFACFVILWNAHILTLVWSYFRRVQVSYALLTFNLGRDDLDDGSGSFYSADTDDFPRQLLEEGMPSKSSRGLIVAKPGTIVQCHSSETPRPGAVQLKSNCSTGRGAGKHIHAPSLGSNPRETAISSAHEFNPFST